MSRIPIILALAAAFAISARGQSFLNLSFESAQNLPANPPIPDGADVAATNALPNWAAYNGSLALAQIDYVSNNFSGYSTVVELEGGSLALSGDFSVGLYGISSITQTGLVPGSAESLQFEASSDLNLTVTLGGQNLLYSALSKGPDYTVYGANIPAGTDGQVESLTFGMQEAGTLLDNIEFSTSSVPEPGEWTLAGIGAVLVAVQCCRGKQRRQRSRVA